MNMTLAQMQAAGATMGGQTGGYGLSFDQSKQALGNANTMTLQQMQAAGATMGGTSVDSGGQPAQPSTMNATGSDVVPTGGNPLTNIVNNAKQVPNEIMGVANTVANAVAPQAVDTMSSGIAGIEHPVLNAEGDIAQPSTKTMLEGSAEMGAIGLPDVAAEEGTTALAARSAAKSGEAIVDMVSPKLTAKETADAIASQGTKKVGILGKTVLNTSNQVKNIANSIREAVPDLDPSKPLTENINKIKGVVSTMASDLKNAVITSGKDRIYSFQELGSQMGSALSKSDVSLGLKSSQFQNAGEDLKGAALDIAKKAGGNVSSLLDVRQEFDQLVNKVYPNLYDKEYTPVRNAVKAIRDTMTDFTEKNLPSGVKLKKNLTTQSNLLRAVENMSEKAASGAEKEIGTSALGRITQTMEKHPLITAGVGALGYEKAKELPIVGKFLP